MSNRRRHPRSQHLVGCQARDAVLIGAWTLIGPERQPRQFSQADAAATVRRAPSWGQMHLTLHSTAEQVNEPVEF